MREILFRGKRTDWGNEWEYGFYTLFSNGRGLKAAIITGTEKGCVIPVEIFPETLGQYTGLTDKNGAKIFEGDIVKATVIYNEYWKDTTRKETRFYEIKYHEEYCYFYLARKRDNRLFDGNWSYGVTRLEVIGNIHDNPELLGGEA